VCFCHLQARIIADHALELLCSCVHASAPQHKCERLHVLCECGSSTAAQVSIPYTTYTIDIPAASMALFNTAAIILLVPLWDRVVEPALRRNGIKLTLLQRIGGWGVSAPYCDCFSIHDVAAWHVCVPTMHGGCHWCSALCLQSHCILGSSMWMSLRCLSDYMCLALVGWGMAISVLAIWYAAGIEAWRLKVYHDSTNEWECEFLSMCLCALP